MENTIIILMLSQVITALGTIAVIKTDIVWIKKSIDKHEEKINALEKH